MTERVIAELDVFIESNVECATVYDVEKAVVNSLPAGACSRTFASSSWARGHYPNDRDGAEQPLTPLSLGT
ncbi:hypothetical protein ASF88_00080 [Leifsonia sp. Leaf336]|uniref:hypothetical protein n=1 Tax=Leifsonia sp. Leaf336 TaxID=1736341 RepID=UPI0006FF55AB|nr:hypothetical protein [Leifsonia sp. Leaf336]KQR53340.1 hypothetical protein ASF88_00080 [Leifsonia sp. Leaf336]